MKQLMDPWVLQKGYPVVHIMRLNETTGVARQQRHLGEAADPEFKHSASEPFK